MMLERDVLRQVKDVLALKGGHLYRIHQSLGSVRGLPDLFWVKNGRTIFIECKGTNGKLSHYQEKFRREVMEEGCAYWLISDINQLLNLINY